MLKGFRKRLPAETQNAQFKAFYENLTFNSVLSSKLFDKAKLTGTVKRFQSYIRLLKNSRKSTFDSALVKGLLRRNVKSIGVGNTMKGVFNEYDASKDL